MSLGRDPDGDWVGSGKDEPVQLVLTGNCHHFLDDNFKSGYAWEYPAWVSPCRDRHAKT